MSVSQSLRFCSCSYACGTLCETALHTICDGCFLPASTWCTSWQIAGQSYAVCEGTCMRLACSRRSAPAQCEGHRTVCAISPTQEADRLQRDVEKMGKYETMDLELQISSLVQVRVC